MSLVSEISIPNVKVKAEGKRRLRLRENDRFASNPHIVLPQRSHYQLEHATVRSTFPEPLPPYLPRSTSAPSAQCPSSDHDSADAGQFFHPLRGIRKSLRRNEHRAQYLVHHIEMALLTWLNDAYVSFDPNEDGQQGVLGFDMSTGQLLWDTSPIYEIMRSRKRLVWRIEEDAFARYVVHCCCRFHSVVSYSQDVNGMRLTYLLRPNRGRPGVEELLATPPATEYDTTSSIGDQLDEISLGGNEPDLDTAPSLDVVPEDEELGNAAEVNRDNNNYEEGRMEVQYRWPKSALCVIEKKAEACDRRIGGRTQSLWSYVFL